MLNNNKDSASSLFDPVLDDESEDCHLSNGAYKAGAQFPINEEALCKLLPNEVTILYCQRQSLNGN